MLGSYKTASVDQPKGAITDLATDIVDVMRGYKTMQERAEDDLRPIVERLHTLHSHHASALFRVLETYGGEPDKAGSIMGVVHSVVATARDWTGSLDTSALPQILAGEKQVINSYSAAIDNLKDAPRLRGILEDQRAVLRAHIAALEQ
ncbi:DUF2383 domain-containing protein [Tropicimonas sp. S265A]|uniref:DUF2383 domain-containing protein n=1 Tax=Tropicimonas sp. S265A TaxID=3415134 RepID=UPI003C7DC194